MTRASSLPVDIDTVYADSGADPTQKTHQTHHDAVHRVARLLDDVTGLPLDVVNAQTGTAYTPVLSDEGKVIEMNSASDNSVTIPTNASVAFPINGKIRVREYGVGRTSIVAASGVTLNYCGVALGTGQTIKMMGPHAHVTLTKRATNEWEVEGTIVLTSFVMVSPDGTLFSVTVDDTGHLVTTGV